MTQPTMPQPEAPKKKRRGCLYGVLGAAVFVVIIVAASSNGDKDSSGPSKDTGSHSSQKAPAKAEDQVKEFKAYAAKHNVPSGVVAAVGHVIKIQGADGNNDILDSADIYTDYAGDMMSNDSAGAKLIASSFADWQKSRGKDSKNGLVTVYNKSGDMLNNGKY
jgi:hypothetical protein